MSFAAVVRSGRRVESTIARSSGTRRRHGCHGDTASAAAADTHRAESTDHHVHRKLNEHSYTARQLDHTRHLQGAGWVCGPPMIVK